MTDKTRQIFHRLYHRRYHGLYRHARELFIFDLFLLGAAVALFAAAAFFWFWKPDDNSLISLTISAGPERLESGDPTHLTIDYSNQSKLFLHNNYLAIRLPAGFIIDRSKTPASALSPDHLIILPDLKPGSNGQVELFGWFWGVPGAEERFSATFHGKADPEKTIEQTTVFISRLPSSRLRGTLEITENSFPAAAAPFVFFITNSGASTSPSIQLSLFENKAPPDSLTPGPFSLQAGETKVVTGTISVPRDSQTISIKIVPSVIVNNRAVDQTPVEKKIAVFSPGLDLAAQLAAPTPYAEAGRTIPLTVRWKNTGLVPLRHATVRLIEAAGIIDLPASARENNLKIQGNTLVINENSRTTLANLTPGASDEITLNLILLPTFAPLGEGVMKFALTPEIEAGNDASVPGQRWHQTGTTLELPLATEFAVHPAARYYSDEGDQLGRGPLPPRVGQTTKYWVVVRLTNTVNAVRGAEVRIPLLPGTTFTGKQSVTLGPRLNFEADTRRVSWSYEEIPPHSQTTLSFEIAVTPNIELIGKTVLLTDDITIGGTDAAVGKTFLFNFPGLSNALPSTDQGARRGAAVREK